MKKDYKKFAFKIAKKAAKMIRSDFQMKMEKEIKDEDNSPLTKTDLEINKLVIKSVKKQYPSHDILAEEGSDLSQNSEFVWVCDPVDGTIPFSHGVPISTFSLALVHNGKPILGIIVDPFQKNYFFAEKGKGSFLNNEKIKVSERDTLQASVIFVENWKQAPYNVIHLIEALENENCHTPIMKSIAYGAGLVAVGVATGVVFPGKKPWDMAAAKVIIEEAGGKVTDFYGNEQRFDKDIQGTIASNGVLHSKLIDLVRKNILEK